LWSVCLSYAARLNRSTDLDAIWQVHLWGPVAHCVRRGSPTPRERRDWGSNPHPKHATASDLRKKWFM